MRVPLLSDPFQCHRAMRRMASRLLGLARHTLMSWYDLLFQFRVCVAPARLCDYRRVPTSAFELHMLLTFVGKLLEACAELRCKSYLSYPQSTVHAIDRLVHKKTL